MYSHNTTNNDSISRRKSPVIHVNDMHWGAWDKPNTWGEGGGIDRTLSSRTKSVRSDKNAGSLTNLARFYIVLKSVKLHLSA